METQLNDKIKDGSHSIDNSNNSEVENLRKVLKYNGCKNYNEVFAIGRYYSIVNNRWKCDNSPIPTMPTILLSHLINELNTLNENK